MQWNDCYFCPAGEHMKVLELLNRGLADRQNILTCNLTEIPIICAMYSVNVLLEYILECSVCPLTARSL
jgi:hypothetical protein